ncbi:type VII secretion protein EccCa [Actinoplanes sp. NPDC051343]|uniref:type VII secretion protein EccCa n=1 Tax=Actinoplanes sp. NPDC051343 TaxID=3363906 RepID=UPI0037B0C3C7
MPSGELQLQEPPVLPETQNQGMRQALMVLPMAMMSGVILLLFVGTSRGPVIWVVLGMMVLSMGGMAVAQMAFGSADRRQRVAGDRRDYLRYLAQNRRRVRQNVARQREATAWTHPAPRSLWSLAMTSRRWERRPTHPDFLEVRLGTGEQRLATRIVPLQTKPIEDLEPLAAKSLRRFINAYSALADQPVALFLRGFAQVRIAAADREEARAFARALLASLVVFHAPDEVRVALCVDEDGSAAWDWAKWLPHAQHPLEQDGAGAVRFAADTEAAVERLFGEALAARPRFETGAAPSRDEPFVVVLRDGGRLASGARLSSVGYRNVVLIDLDDDAPAVGKTQLTLSVDGDDLMMVQRDRVGGEVRRRMARPDRLSEAAARAVARILSPYRLGELTETTEDTLKSNFDIGALLGIADLTELDLAVLWGPRAQTDRLRVPIGIDSNGDPVELDIKESAQDGMGPHGMLIGATGSGKSELLRTLVLSLATTHSSETLNFVLVDFKGGATFLGLDRLPHTSALITNLANEEALVGRMRDALHGEIVRRQELLRSAGGYSSALDYERARAQGAAVDPLPTLFVIVDEFSELLSAHRDFIELFVMIGRLGRSLGVHLLLASQRLDDGRISQLESHLSYRIGLRTFSAMESRSVIGATDAYELPSAPGNGYLRANVSTLIRFKAAYVSGPYRAPAARTSQDVIQRQVVPYTLGNVPMPSQPEPVEAEPVEEPSDHSDADTVLSLVTGQLINQGPPAHQVWLPPLRQSPTLDHLLPTVAPDPDLGLSAAGWGGNGLLTAPIGYIDKPFQQLRDLLLLELSGAGGHVGVSGAPRTGKSTLIRTLICALALTHTPREVQFYCLDFGGGALGSVAGLPHVGSVAGRLDADRVSRIVREVTNLITARERRFLALGVDSMATYRQMRADGRVTDDPYGDVFLVVDGWFTLRSEFEHLDDLVRRIAAQGLNFGIHLILSAARWSEVYHGMRDQIGTRLELKLGDPVDSVIDMRLAATVPAAPGHGLTADKLHFLAALPRIDGIADGASLGDGVRALVAMADDFWTGPRAPEVRTLPATLPAGSLPAPDGDIRIALGIDEEQLAPVWHDFGELPHLTVLGDDESGKTNVLRHLAHAITSRYTPAEARIMIVDYRRQLFDAVPEGYRLGYAVSPDSTAAAVADAAAGLIPRMPGADVTPAQLRNRDWWQGPQLFILVDDYDLLSGQESPLLPLLPYLAQGADIGFHLVITRGAANAMRMSMDPLIRRIQETNTPDLALSCPPNEGPLLGNVKPRLMPPGRALLCTRRGGRLMQTAWQPVDGLVSTAS